MGVRGLLKYIRTHPETRRRMSLAATAEKVIQRCGNRRAELICDFLNILYWLLQLFHECKVKSKDYSQYSSFYGGDLNDYVARILQFVKALRYLKIEPIFFLDRSCDMSPIASIDLDPHGHQFDLHRFQARHIDRMKVVDKCSEVLTYKPTQDMEVLKKWPLPPLLLIQIQMALARESEKITLIRCKRDADSEIALYAHENDIKVCGILSGDTDMVMFRRCRVFHCKFFDRDNVLGLRKPQLDSKPNDVICEMITPENLAVSLGIRPHDLKNLSVLTGNGYTQHLNLELKVHEKLQLTPPFVQAAATWLKRNTGELLHHPVVAEVCSEHPEYRAAILRTYHVYDECRQPRPVVEVEGHMERAVRFRGDVVEVLKEDEPCIADLLVAIRKLIYKLKGLQEVTEHGRTKGKLYMEIKVPVSHPDSSCLKAKTDLERLVCFFSLVTKARELQDTDLSRCTFPRIPPDSTLTCHRLFKPLFLCAPLIFLLSQGELSATLTENARDALLVSCLTCYAGMQPRRVFFRPSPQAINISVWFACALRHAYQMAETLGLSDFLPLPLPGEIYQQAAYIPYHHIAFVSEREIKQQLKTLQELAETHAIFHNCIELRSFKDLKTNLDSIGSSYNFVAIASLAEAFIVAVSEIKTIKASGTLFQSGKQKKR